MIIELPVLPNARAARRYRMGFFHFSNNNLAMRTACAREIGLYDPAIRTSEDVDLCVRAALSPSWVACREPGVEVRHKARRTLKAMVRQLWGWGINLGLVYRKTGITGLYFYWVSYGKRTIVADWEWPRAPILACGFLSLFHLSQLLLLGAVVSLVAGWPGPAAATAPVALAVLGPTVRPLRATGLGWWGLVRLAAVAYLANVTFMTAAFLGGLRAGMVLIPAPILPTARRAAEPSRVP